MPLANSAQILCGGRDGAVYLWDIRKPTRPVQLLVRTARVPLAVPLEYPWQYRSSTPGSTGRVPRAVPVEYPGQYRSSACMRAWAWVSRVRSFFEWARIRCSVPLRACCRVFTPACAALWSAQPAAVLSGV